VSFVQSPLTNKTLTFFSLWLQSNHRERVFVGSTSSIWYCHTNLIFICYFHYFYLST